VLLYQFAFKDRSFISYSGFSNRWNRLKSGFTDLKANWY